MPPNASAYVALEVLVKCRWFPKSLTSPEGGSLIVYPLVRWFEAVW
jgi:hypothetical protein